MRRSLIVLLAAFVLAALVPSAALATKPDPLVKKVTVTVIGYATSPHLCTVEVKATFTRGRDTAGWTIRFQQLEGGFVVSNPAAVTPTKPGTAIQVFADVALGGNAYLWRAWAMSGDAVATIAVDTNYEPWNDTASCPAPGTVIARYPIS